MQNTALLLLLLIVAPMGQADSARLQAAIDGKHRTADYVMRDIYRHPLQTLQLFDIQPDHTVVEIWPGGGWYTEILAPYLKSDGKLIAAHYDSSDTQSSYRPDSRERFNAKMASNKSVYGKVKIASLTFDEAARSIRIPAAQENSVDRVVTFRNAHAWNGTGTMATAFEHFFSILKPGGKLGVVQHMADPDQDWMSKNIGYIGRNHIISNALKAGFTLAAEGYFNRNSLDNKRYSEGVWQLPPSFRNLKTEAEKAPYRAIGESERMTLVFLKPAID